MPAPQENIDLRDYQQLTVMGLDDSGNTKPRVVLIRRDRSLVIWARQVAFNGTREQVIRSDENDLMRNRPYEPIFPVEPTVLTGSFQTLFTSTGARSELWCDVVNSGNTNGATCRIQHVVAASAQAYDWYPQSTPVPTGVPIRTGFIQLASGDSLKALASGSVTVHVHIHRYNATGDEP